MQKQRMIRMLKDATEAVNEADLASTQNLIGQLILASAIEESGSSISLSLDKLDKLAMELGSVATMLRHR